MKHKERLVQHLIECARCKKIYLILNHGLKKQLIKNAEMTRLNPQSKRLWRLAERCHTCGIEGREFCEAQYKTTILEPLSLLEKRMWHDETNVCMYRELGTIQRNNKIVSNLNEETILYMCTLFRSTYIYGFSN